VFAGPHREQRGGPDERPQLRRSSGRHLWADHRARRSGGLRDGGHRGGGGAPATGAPGTRRAAGHRQSPFRALVGPAIAYLGVLDQAWPPDRSRRCDRRPPHVRAATGGIGCSSQAARRLKAARSWAGR
jgi:hypothetical protein